ncbi:Cation/H(+) antiporter 19, partial [Mucuna pruriens]
MKSLGYSVHVTNQLVLSHAPCSVAILVDRGLGGTSQVQASEVSYKVVVPFFGGRDDRDALCYWLGCHQTRTRKQWMRLMELEKVIGFMASSDFSTVMVIQQYNPSTDIHPLVMENTYILVDRDIA